MDADHRRYRDRLSVRRARARHQRDLVSIAARPRRRRGGRCLHLASSHGDEPAADGAVGIDRCGSAADRLDSVLCRADRRYAGARPRHVVSVSANRRAGAQSASGLHAAATPAPFSRGFPGGPVPDARIGSGTSPPCGASAKSGRADSVGFVTTGQNYHGPRRHDADQTRFAMLDLGLSFLGSVARDPDALAIVDRDLRLSYAQWYRRISALVAGLDALGLRRGDHIVTLLQNRWEAATLHWACQFAGIIITPVNWRSTPSELDFFVEDAEARALVYEAVSAAAVEAANLARRLPRIALDSITAGAVSFAELAGRASDRAPDAQPRAGADDRSVMLYTSGTTARPKGVPRRQRAERAAAVAHVAQNLYGRGERTLGVMPLYHTMGVRSLLAMSLIGGTFICLRRFEPARALELIEAEEITNLYLVPTLYHDLVHHQRFSATAIR